MISSDIFGPGLWIAYVLVAAGAFYLLAVLAREWRDGKLW